MAKTGLNDVLAQATDGAEGLTAAIPENWMQGRTTYGGLSAALMLEAALRAEPDLPPLRSALVSFVGPVGAQVEIRAERLRQGRNVTQMDVRAHCEGQVVATGGFAFGATRDSEMNVPHPAPDAPAPETLSPLYPPGTESFLPPFISNFEMRPIEGNLPGSGADRGYMRAWVRHRDPAAWNGTVPLLCLGDILPPAIFPMLPRMAPNSSLTWMFNLLNPAARTRDGWWQAETALTAGTGGYSSQVMRMWSSDGELVVDGMQSVVVFI